jgi:hypothetical protein
VSYRGTIQAIRALVPATVPVGFTFPDLKPESVIDREIIAKLRRLNMAPSAVAGDLEFLRRVTIDTIGCLPTPDEARAFLADTDSDKRAKKIDALLAHPLHAALWATKFSDITGNNFDQMEQPQNLRSKRAKMWHDWFRRRLEKNVPYDQIVKGVLTATSRDGLSVEEWLLQTIALEESMQKGFDHAYADRPTLDLFWRRLGLTPEVAAEQTAAAFLGVRIDCAQCHKHPFDRWTQADYRSYANIFGGVRAALSPEAAPLGNAINRRRREEAGPQGQNRIFPIREVFVDARNPRQLRHPDTGRPLPAKALGGPELERGGDPREALFTWMTTPDNPFFARAFVNRVWAHYFGRGIVHPADNFAAANPPSHPALLDELAKNFVESKFDIRRLERTVLLSQTYQRSATPNETNAADRGNFARSYPRRLMAEVVVDVLDSALGVTERYGPDVPAGSKAIEVAPSRVGGEIAYLFRVFGRPIRTTSCDCERPAEPALPQTLFLMSDPVLVNKITSGRLRQLLGARKADEAVLDEMFLATLTRFPTEEEKQATLAYVTERKSNRPAAWVDVVWALVNTREFILNH